MGAGGPEEEERNEGRRVYLFTTLNPAWFCYTNATLKKKDVIGEKLEL